MKSHEFLQGALVALVIFFFGLAPVFGLTDSGRPSVPSVDSPALRLDKAEKAEDKELGEERDVEDEDLEEARDAEDKDIKEERSAEDKDIKEERSAEDKDIEEERDAEDEDISDARAQDKKDKGLGADRRSRVANAVKELLAVADREGGIGEQVREIAKSQQEDLEEAEDDLEEAKDRKGWVKFLIGPNYKLINLVEDRLEEVNQQLDDLKNLRGKLANPEDAVLLDSQVEAIKQLQAELQAEAEDSKKGFSLFGWLVKLLSK